MHIHVQCCLTLVFSTHYFLWLVGIIGQHFCQVRAGLNCPSPMLVETSNHFAVNELPTKAANQNVISSPALGQTSVACDMWNFECVTDTWNFWNFECVTDTWNLHNSHIPSIFSKIQHHASSELTPSNASDRWNANEGKWNYHRKKD
jgi:hypothetical protein